MFNLPKLLLFIAAYINIANLVINGTEANINTEEKFDTPDIVSYQSIQQFMQILNNMSDKSQFAVLSVIAIFVLQTIIKSIYYYKRLSLKNENKIKNIENK